MKPGETLRITERLQLVELARMLKLRPDWHEPDEQGIIATVEGVSFNNAGTWPLGSIDALGPTGNSDDSALELHVILWRTMYDPTSGRSERVSPAVATINLATLFAWAVSSEEDNTTIPRRVIDDVLERAGIEHPRGVLGVRDLVAQRDGYLDRIRELEDRVTHVQNLCDRMERNPAVSDRVPVDIRRALVERPIRRATETEVRARIAGEIREHGEFINDVVGGPYGEALRAVIGEVAEHVSRGPGVGE